ncbi:hypothetical protein CUMW_236510 [Citrus unshiu]|nr:hypothetical protein CUMW_236510 [Citrus unshiu]
MFTRDSRKCQNHTSNSQVQSNLVLMMQAGEQDYENEKFSQRIAKMFCWLSWYVEYHLQGFERAFAVKSVVTSSCNCTFIQSTSMLGFQVLTLVRPRIRLAMEPLPLLLLCKV